MLRYLPRRYFATSYFLACDPCQILLAPTNDFAVLSALESLLAASGEFAHVSFERSPRVDHPVHLLPSASLVPLAWSEHDDADPDVVLRTVRFEIVIAARSIEPRASYNRLCSLATKCQELIDATNVGGLTLAGRTRLGAGALDQAARPPEMRVKLVGEFAYTFRRSVGRLA